MRIAYLIHWNEGPESGVFKKVANQMAEWVRLGHEVALFLFTHRQEVEWSREIPEIEVIAQTYGGGLRRFIDFKHLAAQVVQWSPDLLYHRFDLFYFSLPKLLRTFPSILEVNTNDVTELRMKRNARYYYHLCTRGRVLGAAKGFVFVSEELFREKHYSRYVTSSIVIGNGIDLDQRQSSPPPARDSSEVRLLFIGSAGQSWHGVDSIAQLAEAHPEWKFDLIGMEASELGTSTAVPGNMTFHGILTTNQYQPLMDQAHIAIGTLGLYRKQMKEASPLKVREYLANGLPVIIGYQDTDFPEPVPFILELPNEPSNTISGIEQIEQFVEVWASRRVQRDWISHLDNSVKETNRVNYMKQIVENRDLP